MRLALVLCCGPFLVVFDSNLVTVALPSIRDSFDLPYDDLQWIVSAYALAFGAALLLAARAVDVVGGRRLLLWGLSTFTTAVAGCALAPSPGALIGLRAIQGVGAALMLPSCLALLSLGFAEGRPRRRALGLYGVAASSAFLAGVLVGGLLCQELSWRGALAVEVPLGVCGIAAARRLVRRETRMAVQRFDVRVALGLAASAAMALYGLADLTRGGTSALRGGAILLLTAAIAGRTWTLNGRSPTPLVPGSLRSSWQLRSACVAAFLTVGAGVGAMFVLTVYLQEVLDLDPSSAGVMLAFVGVSGVAAGLALPPIALRLGVRRSLCASLLLRALGSATLIHIGWSTSLGWLLAGTVLLGAGHFAATVAFTALAMERIPPAAHGIAMGLLGSCQQLGGAFGLALLAGIASANSNLVDGLRWSLVGAACLSAAGALITSMLGRRRQV